MPKEKTEKPAKTAAKQQPKAKTGQQTEKTTPQKEKGEGLGRRIWAVIAIVVILFAIAGALVYGLVQNGSSNFATFQSNFNSAPRVAILVTAYNGTAISATVGCASSIIEQVVASHTDHRNASTIDFYVLNATSCVFSASGVYGQISNYSYATPSSCINVSMKEPSIFINYSNTNTTIIGSRSLVVEGDAEYLTQCAVASELVGT